MSEVLGETVYITEGTCTRAGGGRRIAVPFSGGGVLQQGVNFLACSHLHLKWKCRTGHSEKWSHTFGKNISSHARKCGGNTPRDHLPYTLVMQHSFTLTLS